MKKLFNSFTLSLFFSLVLFQTLQAQQNRVGNTPLQASETARHKNVKENSDSHNQPIDAPIDGGISILLAAGVAYGFKMIRDRQADIKVEAAE